MFTVALFIVAKTWTQHKHLLTDEWIKMWYIQTIESYLVIRNNETIPFTTTWMDLEIFILSVVIQREKDIYHMISLLCGL